MICGKIKPYDMEVSVRGFLFVFLSCVCIYICTPFNSFANNDIDYTEYFNCVRDVFKINNIRDSKILNPKTIMNDGAVKQYISNDENFKKIVSDPTRRNNLLKVIERNCTSKIKKPKTTKTSDTEKKIAFRLIPPQGEKITTNAGCKIVIRDNNKDIEIPYNGTNVHHTTTSEEYSFYVTCKNRYETKNTQYQTLFATNPYYNNGKREIELTLKHCDVDWKAGEEKCSETQSGLKKIDKCNNKYFDIDEKNNKCVSKTCTIENSTSQSTHYVYEGKDFVCKFKSQALAKCDDGFEPSEDLKSCNKKE